MNSDSVLRQQILALLKGGNAHMGFDDLIDNFPQEHMNSFPPHVPYSFWHLLEHMRITQWDILEFMRNPEYQALDWPTGYWPPQQDKADPARWQQTVVEFQRDLAAVQEMVKDTRIKVTSEIPHATGYTYVREYLLVADHNAYHIGEFGILRQIMGLW